MPADPKGNRLAILLAALFGLTVLIVNGQATVINGSPPTITTTAVGTTSQPTSREQQVLRAKDTQGEAVPGVGLVAEAEVPVLPEATSRALMVELVVMGVAYGVLPMEVVAVGVTDHRPQARPTLEAVGAAATASERTALLGQLVLRTQEAAAVVVGKVLALGLAGQAAAGS